MKKLLTTVFLSIAALLSIIFVAPPEISVRAEEQEAPSNQEADNTYFTVYFHEDLFGEKINTQKVKNGETVSHPDNPTKDGFIFEGWSTRSYEQSDQLFNFNTPITGDLNLYAVWQAKDLDVYFVDSLDQFSYDSFKQSVEYGQKATKPQTIPMKPGYTFLFWSTQWDNDVIIGNTIKEFDFNTPITEDTTLYAIWQKDTVDVTLQVSYDDVVTNIENIKQETIGRNSILSLPEVSLLKGYTFKKWVVQYRGNGRNYESQEFDYNAEETIGQNIDRINESLGYIEYLNEIEITAKTEPVTLNVVYHLNGVSQTDVLTQRKLAYSVDGDFWNPNDLWPCVSGYAFLGWYTDEAGTSKTIDWDKVHDNTLDIYASWLKFSDDSTTPVSVTNTTVINIYNTMISVPDTGHGTTEISIDKNSNGKRALITAKPDTGYELDSIHVVDNTGHEIKLERIGNNIYTFTVPKEKAAVVTTYRKKVASDSRSSSDTRKGNSSKRSTASLQNEIDDLQKQLQRQNRNASSSEIKELRNEIDDLKQQLAQLLKSTSQKDASIVSMRRLYNPNTGEHFYTASNAEMNNLVESGWTLEGTGWNAPSVSKTPVYRLYNPNAGDHHFTISANERNTLIRLGWKDEGIGWYSSDKKDKPLYRQYNPNAKSGSHNYTTSLSENNYLASLGWKAEGIAWYAE